MPFVTFEPKREYTDFAPTVFTKIKEHAPVRVRILDSEAVMVHKHYVPSAKASPRCLGYEGCPICINNKKLIDANPTIRPGQIKGYMPRQTRYMLNVLNKTPAKRTSDGDLVFPTNGVYPATHPKTGEDLTAIEPTPANRVEVLERGVTLFQQLDAINNTLTDEAGNPLGIWTYDVIISASGKGKDMVTMVTPNVAANSPVDLEELGLEKYDLEDVSLSLNAEEVEKLLRGISLKDIFTGREVQDIVEKKVGETGEDVIVDVDQTIAELFND